MFRLLTIAQNRQCAKRCFSILQKDHLRTKVNWIYRVQKHSMDPCIKYSNDTIYAAIQRNDYEKIKHFLKFRTAYPNLVEAAIVFGDCDSIKLILESKKIDVNADLGNGIFALNYAVEQNNLDVVTLLLEKGADTECRDSSGRTSLTIAKSNNNLPMVDLLLSYGAGLNQ
jgi:ankyrin repeat protein